MPLNDRPIAWDQCHQDCVLADYAEDQDILSAKIKAGGGKGPESETRVIQIKGINLSGIHAGCSLINPTKRQLQQRWC